MSAREALERSRPLVVPEAIGWGRRAHPERAALIFRGERRTHAELDDRAGRLAGALGAHGVRAGDRVALLLHNGFEFVESMLACHRLGACAVPNAKSCVRARLVAKALQHVQSLDYARPRSRQRQTPGLRDRMHSSETAARMASRS